MLHLQGIDVYYQDVQVLREVSLTVREKEIVTVIGPNGAGKSTLLNTIIGFLHPARGSIRFKEHRVDGLSPDRLVSLGMTIVPEGARIFPEMSVKDNLLMGSYLPSVRARRKENLERVLELFPLLGMRGRQKAGTLSGGERQMLAIGRALMSSPSLLLLDEPSLGLQPSLVTRVFEKVGEIASGGLTVLLVEQNVYFALEMAHRAYVLENGSVALEGRGTDLLRNDHIRKAYLAV